MKISNVKEYKNIKEIIYNSVTKYPDNIAFVVKNKKENSYKNITYKEMLEDINAFGSKLYTMGLKNKRVAVIGKNRYEWTLTHLAVLLGEMVLIPLDKDLQYDELENSLIRSKADCIVFDPKLSESIEEIRKNGKTNISKYICMEEKEDFFNIKELVREGKMQKQNEYISTKIDENKMSILLFTSGTTAKSKAVMLSQKNIASNIYAMQLVEDIRSDDVNIAFLPFHHIFGSTCMIMMLACGVKTVFPDGLRYIQKNLCEYKVSVFVGVPVLIEAIYKSIKKETQKQGKVKILNVMIKISNILRKCHIDLRKILFKSIVRALGGNLRFIISGGAPADKNISKWFNDIGIQTVQGYGLSETAPVIAAENYAAIKAGSVGLPMANDTVEIVEKDNDGIGQIRVKGPNVMIGYYEMPELTNEVLRNGWFYTGDLGYIDKEGYLFITGRNKNMIVLKNGKKVFPEELEMLVNRMELVSESMVFGMPSQYDKDDVKLSVKIVYNVEVAKEKYAGKTEKELYEILWNDIKALNKTFPRYKHIQNMILTSEELIKTSTKKVKRQEEMKKICSML